MTASYSSYTLCASLIIANVVTHTMKDVRILCLCSAIITNTYNSINECTYSHKKLAIDTHRWSHINIRNILNG